MKVLISDDEHHVIQAIRLLVPWEEFGIDQIYTASNGMEALDIITREVPEIVITDIVMEDKNGIDIMDFIATRHPSIKVIAVSGHNLQTRQHYANQPCDPRQPPSHISHSYFL